MRADARRNRQKLIDAAIEVILEVGGDPPRDAVAARAGVGIGTLYRHFPDRQSLLGAVAVHVIDSSIDAGEAALRESDDGVDALRRYLHAAVDIGLGALNLVHPLIDEPGWPERRERAEALLDELTASAARSGRLRSAVTASDVGFAILRFCRPLAVGLTAARERELAHRHVDIHVDGLTR